MNKQKKRGFLKVIFNNSFFRHLLVFWKAISSSWRIYLAKPLTLEEVRLNREAASIPSFGFFFLLICAAIIASFGLVADSTAVIIGAMIVAPLMNPILSMAFAIVTRDWTLFDTLPITNREILGSTSPLNLNSLRYLSQRWFSPQALTLGMPYPSCSIANCV